MDRKRVSSEHLKSVGYDGKRKTLEIEFVNGSVYRYYGISPQRYRAFQNADSLGSYFNQRIRSGYEVSKMKE